MVQSLHFDCSQSVYLKQQKKLLLGKPLENLGHLTRSPLSAALSWTGPRAAALCYH